jgi:hypothetical protein
MLLSKSSSQKNAGGPWSGRHTVVISVSSRDTGNVQVASNDILFIFELAFGL